MTRRPRRRLSLLWLFSCFIPSLSSPLTAHEQHNTTHLAAANHTRRTSFAEQEHDAQGTGLMVSWLWGLVWGDDSTVSVVDRTPALNFNARPAAFGPSSDVLGYLIRVEDFSVPCEGEDGGGSGGGDGGGDGGGGGDGDGGGDTVVHRGEVPWWPGGADASSLSERGQRAWQREARYGCPHLCVRGKDRPQSSETWMALVMRGGCTFVDKVRQAQRFGAKGVVVGGETEAQDHHGDGLVQMFSLGDSSDIQIPSTYITHDSYETLSSLIASSNTSIFGLRTVSVGIITDTSGWEWYSPLLTFLILLFLPSSLTLCTLLVHRVRAARAAQRERAPEDVVQNLPWRVWDGQKTLWELEKHFDPVKNVAEERGDSHERAAASSRGRELLPGDPPEAVRPSPPSTPTSSCEPSTSSPSDRVDMQIPLVEAARKWYETQVECAICLEDFVKGDKVRVLPCRHIFHMEEVDDWLIQRKKLCPICKHDVTRPLFASSPTLHSDSRSDPDPAAEADAGDETLVLPTIYENGTTEPTERTPLLQRAEGT